MPHGTNPGKATVEHAQSYIQGVDLNRLSPFSLLKKALVSQSRFSTRFNASNVSNVSK